MRLRLLLAAAATLALAACGDSSTAPRQMRAGTRTSDESLTCRSGYHIATRADGTQFCEEDAGTTLLSAPAGTSASPPMSTPPAPPSDSQ